MPELRHSDDDLWRGSFRWLGPKGYTLPISVPYSGVVPGAVAFVVTLLVLSLFGVGGWRFLISGAIAVAVMKTAGHLVSSERPMSSVTTIVTQETQAPRQQAREPVRAVLRPGAIPVYELPARPHKEESR